jgi:hypothetical protein
VASLVLERTGGGTYRVEGVGTLRRTPRFGAVIEAGGVSWRLSRTLFGLGQAIEAVDAGAARTGGRAAYYKPHGPLHLRGIFSGTIESGGRRFDWRANHQLGHRFALAEAGAELGRFEAGSPREPVRITLTREDAVPPLVLLLCCHIVLQVLYTSEVAAVAGAGVAASA